MNSGRNEKLPFIRHMDAEIIQERKNQPNSDINETTKICYRKLK